MSHWPYVHSLQQIVPVTDEKNLPKEYIVETPREGQLHHHTGLYACPNVDGQGGIYHETDIYDLEVCNPG